MSRKKTHKTFEEQIQLLQKRGLEIPLKNEAIHTLQTISYYRLTSYRFPFVLENKETYKSNTTFKNLADLYHIDNIYKMYLYTLLQYVEVAIKTQVMHYFSENDPYFYYQNSNFQLPKNEKTKEWFKHTFLPSIKTAIKNLDNNHIKYFAEKHDTKKECKSGKCYKKCNCYPPIWIAVEALTFGQVINIYKYYSSQEQKLIICKFFKLNNINPFLDCLSELKIIRNLVAHHDIMLNRKSFPKSTTIGILSSLYDTPINKEYEETYLPYFLLIKHVVEIVLSKNDYIAEFYKQFLELSKQNKKYLSLEKLDNKYFEFIKK